MILLFLQINKIESEISREIQLAIITRCERNCKTNFSLICIWLDFIRIVNKRLVKQFNWHNLSEFWVTISSCFENSHFQKNMYQNQKVIFGEGLYRCDVGQVGNIIFGTKIATTLLIVYTSDRVINNLLSRFFYCSTLLPYQIGSTKVSVFHQSIIKNYSILTHRHINLFKCSFLHSFSKWWNLVTIKHYNMFCRNE